MKSKTTCFDELQNHFRGFQWVLSLVLSDLDRIVGSSAQFESQDDFCMCHFLNAFQAFSVGFIMMCGGELEASVGGSLVFVTKASQARLKV